MRSEVAALVLIVGACTWAFRYFPLRARLHDLAAGSVLGRFLAATGPAAIATLFAAEVMPYLQVAVTGQLPLLTGIAAVLAAFAWRRSVVVATLAGSVTFGVISALVAS